MSLFFDEVLKLPNGSATVHSAWHDSGNVLAVCSYSVETTLGEVNLYLENGEKANTGTLIQRSCQPSISAWHPTRKILAVAWANGEVVVWNDSEKQVYETARLHSETITTISWSGNGKRLLSGDTKGVTAIWKADEKGRLQHDPIVRKDFKFRINNCIAKSIYGNNTALKNIASLARAAVSGDESALDMFAVFGNSNKNRKFDFGKLDESAFFLGLENGSVKYINDTGNTNDCLTLSSSIKKMLYYDEHDILVIVSSELDVIQGRVHADGKLEEIGRFKFSGMGNQTDISWASNGVLVAATAERSIKLWDLNTNINYGLTLATDKGFKDNETITSVAFSKEINLLAAGTNFSNLAMWRYIPSLSENSEQDWQLLPVIPNKDTVLHLDWCPRKGVLASSNKNGVKIYTEQKMNWGMSETLLGIQTSPKTLILEVIGTKKITSTAKGKGLTAADISSMSPSRHINSKINVETDISFNGLYVANEAIALWDGKQVYIYEITNGACIPAGNFSVPSNICVIHDQSFFSIENSIDGKGRNKINVRNFQGTVKQTLQFQDSDGNPFLMNICGNYLAIGTKIGCICLYDLSRREVKAHCNMKNLTEEINYFGSIANVVSNSTGTHLAVTYKMDNGIPSTRLCVYNIENDKFVHFDFLTGKQVNDSTPDSVVPFQTQSSKCSGRYPVAVHWDTDEPRLLACEANLTPDAKKELLLKQSATSILSGTVEPPPQIIVVSMFMSNEEGMVVQDFFGKPLEASNFIGIKVPYFYFSIYLENQIANKSSSVYIKRIMQDFHGLENCDEDTKYALIDFSFYLTIGNMDKAFKAIKLIKSKLVWESMSRMCVKMKRLDVARVCLGNMGHIRGAQALRESETEPELDARVAALAVQLGMNEEAEMLYTDSKRYDLLNKFYQASGQWGKALETAELHDRIHLRTTYFGYAKHLESSGDIAAAIPFYEKANCHNFEVPRMLFDDIDMLDTYIHKSKDPRFRKWWAQYLESTGEMEEALKYYQQAGDILSLVRVYCYCNEREKAAEIANESGNRAACYHLARHFENLGDVKQAIHFYTRAETYGNAVRICKEHGFEDQLMNLALLGSSADMLEAAMYYEDRPDVVDKAVMLYHKAGHFSKALQLAFDTQQFGALELIAQDLDDRTDPVLLEKCANFFMEHGQHSKAVSLLTVAKKFSEAIDLCSQHSIGLDEDLVERLTIPKDDESYSASTREHLLTKLADCCLAQGEYRLACTKYTQAGKREKAMRALLKSGDTEKIIFYAGVSRSRNIYVMAANYLQSLDWRKDPEIMKHIISYYTKGRALDSLAGFYDACAQVEIDEYQNYEKAVGALTEAYKCITKAKMADKQQQEEKITELKSRIALIKKFLHAKMLFGSNGDDAVKQCQVLLAERDLDSAVRLGDVYGLLVEHYARQTDYDKAYHMMQEMKSRISSVQIAYYVNMQTIEAVHSALNIPLGRGTGVEKSNGIDVSDEEDGIGEEIFNGDDSNEFPFH